MLTRFSGELNLYVTSLNSTQNLANNLPDSTQNKWLISHTNSQSFLNIPVQDPQACISCLYIIRIEALESSSFSLRVNEGDIFVPLQDGFPYSEQLEAQGYAPFELRSFSDIEEAQLKVDLAGSEIEILISNSSKISVTNYLWKKTVTSNTKSNVIPLKKSHQDEVFYILFYNPANMRLSYNFTMTMKSSKSFLFPNEDFKADDFQPYQKISLLYYSHIENGELHFYFRFTAAYKEGYNVQELFLSALRQGQIIKGRYWPEEETPGPGQEVLFEISAPEIEDHDTWAKFRQDILIKSSAIGKYSIEVANPWDFPFTFSIKGPNMLSAENFQDMFYNSIYMSKTYGMFMSKTSVKWYNWVYSSMVPVDLKIEAGNQEKEHVRIPQGKSFMYKEEIGNSNIKDRFRDVIVTDLIVKDEAWNTVFVYSSLINESKFWDYEVKKDEDLNMRLSYNYERDNSQLMLEFDPVEFQDPEPTDKVNYNIQICSFRDIEYIKNPRRLCDAWAHDSSYADRWIGGCQYADVELPINRFTAARVQGSILRILIRSSYDYHLQFDPSFGVGRSLIDSALLIFGAKPKKYRIKNSSHFHFH